MSNKTKTPFKISTAFDWPVTFTYGVDGEYIDSLIDVRFERLKLSVFVEKTQTIVELERAGKPAIFEIQGFLRGVVKGVSNMEFDQETSTVDAIEMVLEDMGICAAMYTAYNSAILGRDLSLGNSEPLPDSAQD